MSWTSLSIIRQHLQDSGIAVDSIRDEKHTLIGTEITQLGHAYISDDSEKVKTIDSVTPYYDGSNRLSGTSWKSLDHESIVSGTFVAASSTLLNTIYIEDVDFVVDYDAGKIKRVADGSIPDNAMVYIWYQYYTVHSRDADYSIDYEAGTLQRLAGGGIADGSQIWADYTLSVFTIMDNLVNQAIIEAEGKILDRLSPDYSSDSTDQGLKTGATELTLSIMSREMATEAMRIYASDQAAAIAKQWRELSLRYEQQAWKTLARFLAPPVLRSATVQTNQSYSAAE
jgi:hypothetical protein